jgi:hypothetical protein
LLPHVVLAVVGFLVETVPDDAAVYDAEEDIHTEQHNDRDVEEEELNTPDDANVVAVAVEKDDW